MRARPGMTAGAELLASAVALRWSRPDLTAAIAEHVATTWAADDHIWVAAAGWLVHGRAAVGDGRECASDTMAELMRRDPALLDDPAADRLRIEVATLAATQREPAVARLLVGPLSDERPAATRADVLAVLARCAFEDRPGAVGEATRRAASAWAVVPGVDADIAVAALTLLSASSARRAGHPDAAVDAAAEGLARLDDLREGASASPLAVALAAEWITALIEAGRVDDARAGCEAMAERHLGRTARPTRQTALLRLTVARAIATSTSTGAFEALEQAATDAAQCDTPDLEGLCFATLGTLREKAGRLDAALESMRRGVAAQRRDRGRSERFRAALRELPLRSPGSVASSGRPGVTAPVPIARVQSDGVPARPDEPHLPPFDRSPGPWTTGCWTVDGGPTDMRRLGRAVAASALVRSASVDLREAAAGPVIDDIGGAKVVPIPDNPLPPDRATAGDTGFDPLFGPLDSLVESRVGDGPNGGEATTQANPGPDAATGPTTPKPSPYDRDGWLANALAELDRAWGAPLPGLGAVRESLRTAETSHAGAPSSAYELPDAQRTPLSDDHDTPDDLFADAGLDEQEASPWASWADARVAPRMAGGQPGSGPGGEDRRDADGQADNHGELWPASTAAAPSVADDPAGSDGGRLLVGEVAAPSEIGSVGGDGGRRPLGDVAAPGDVVGAPGLGVVGCVVVVDLVCAGEPVTTGSALLRGVMERLADQIPVGSRLRVDDAGSALSVVLPEHDRTGACDWMHRTLPAVFRGTAAPNDPVLPVGTALRATVHDTDGPVGAQLLQRLDRARRGDAPSVPVKWGVPIAAGSGGRRRRPDGESTPSGQAEVRIRTEKQAGKNGAFPVVRWGRHRQSKEASAERSAVVARPSPVVRASDSEPPVEPLPSAANDAETVGSRDDAVCDQAELSVEGLGLADLLAGALAAYRAI